MAFATPKRSKTNDIISKFNSVARTATTTNNQHLKRPANKLNETPVNVKCKKQDVTTTISTTSQHQHDANQITVAVRIRPLDGKEAAAGHFNAVKRLNETSNQIMVVMPENNRAGGSSKQPPLTFPCDIIITDQVASEMSSEQNGQQQYVYERLGRPLLDQAFDGYNVSIFAYGQTGSGKTYSMIGTQSEPGLIPRFFDQLFERINENTKENYNDQDEITRSTHVEISYYEIYNEKIYDLLRSTDPASLSAPGGKKIPNSSSNGLNGRNLQIREDPQTGPFIVDLQTLSASTSADAKLWLDIGNKRRATACTNMNQKSSRSHSVFQITLTQMVEQKQQNASTSTGEQKLLQLVTSKINLVDLAGSERINSSFNPNTPMTTSVGASQRLKESTCINKSLLTLGKIICQLAERQQHHHNASAADLANSSSNQNAAMIVNTPTASNNAGGGSSATQLHLPYRESTLTWLLKESLGGNAKTAMLATVCASSAYVDETVCTLRYATKTASIKTAAHLNCNYRRKYIDEYGRENEITLLLPPMSALDSNSLFLKQQQRHQQLMEEQSQKHEVLEKRAGELEQTLKSMEVEWREKLARAELLKQKEIADMEKSLIALYGNETCSRNCCLINLNEDPSLSEKLIYLLKSDANTTLIGSDKPRADIHLSSALVATQHARILKVDEADGEESYYIEHLDENYVTYLNGDMLLANTKYKLTHGDRIIFGGSMFFRFNNPSAKNASANGANGATGGQQFKDYQFAKNEIERKQNELIQKRLEEAVSKCKEDGEEKLKQLKQEYEKVKSDLEREKIERKIELQKIKIQSQKRLRQIEQKKIIEANLNMVQSEMAAVSKEIEAQERELQHNETVSDLNSTSSSTATANTTDTFASSCKTPFVNKRLLNMLYSEKKTSVKMANQHELIQTHTNANSLFAITLHVTEANKICHSLGLEYVINHSNFNLL